MTRVFKFHFIIILQLCYLSVSADLLPVEAFGRLPEAKNVKLSPKGDQIAFIKNIKGNTYIAVTNVAAKKTTFLIGTDNQKFKIGWYVWANNEVLLISTDYPVKSTHTKYTETRLLKVNSDGSSTAEAVIKLRPKDQPAQIQNNIVDMLPEDPDHILMALALKYPNRPDVYKINLKSSKSRPKLYTSKRFIYDWMTDRQHRVRLGFGKDETRIFYRLLDLETEEWRNIWEYEIFDAPDIRPLGFGLDPNQLYIRANHEGRYAIFKVDLSKPELPRELIYADKNYDIEGSLIYSKKSNDVIGVYHGEADDSKIYFDPSYSAFQKELNKTIPNAYNNITSLSTDERKYILFTSNPESPGAYYLGNKDTNELSFILEQYPLLFQQKLSNKQKIVYKARDGLKIEGYLTAPHKNTPESNAAIILPHGGPMARNYGGFSWFSQFFASRGYTVLEPNFRGSSGYGFKFEMESIKKWGGAMQDDLADAAKWLTKNHNINKDKICILGSSYGGYAAMMAAVKQQDTFRCAASFAGISDLEDIVKRAKRFNNFKITLKQFGSNSDLLEKKSPINFAKKINIPIMLIHGVDDRVVDISQSRNMFDKLEDYDKNVEYIELEKGNHHLEIEANRIMALASLERFLRQNLAIQSVQE